VKDRQARLTKARERLDYLASLRAEYSSLNAETQSRTRQLETAEKQLVDARAAQAGAAATSLVSRIDSPTAGSRPLGPGKTTIIGAGCVGGLLLGAGLLLLTVTPPTRPAAPSSSSEPRTLATVSAAAA
jgi:succinoglycan biosynthesis transport protein ExoP